MDTLDLARLQFAVTTSLHFLFAILTLGLAPLVALLQTIWVVRGSSVHERLTRFWGQIYVINYGLGIVTGLLLEFQFSLNWTGLTEVAGDVFGAPMAMETLAAFFVESTFLGLWIFGWGRLPKVVHLLAFYMVGAAALASAYFIVVANGFLQRPVGFERDGDVMRITDLGALLTNPAALWALAHILPASWMVAGFFMAGISAWHFVRRTEEVRLFRTSLRLGLVVGYVGAFFTVGLGFSQLAWITEGQPTKFAGGDKADELQAEFAARFGPGDYIPPTWVPVAFALMMFIGLIYLLVAWIPVMLLLTGAWFERRRFLLRIGVWTIPVPFIATMLGWQVREIGRQPWVVYEQLKTADAVSSVGRGTVLTAFIAFTAVYVLLVTVNYVLIARVARAGPDAVVLGRTLAEAES